jgi:hypothetical protein
MLLQSCGKSLSKYAPMPTADQSLVSDVQNKLIQDEMSYNRPALAGEHKIMMSTMTAEQRTVYDRIMTRVGEGKPSPFFLYERTVYDRTVYEVAREKHSFGGLCVLH